MQYVLSNEHYPQFATHYDIRFDEEDPKLVIEISGQLTKNELTNLINFRWNDISQIMQRLPKVDSTNISVLELAKKVYDLRKNGMKYREIADILEEENPNDDSGIYNEDYIKTLFNRYKKIFE